MVCWCGQGGRGYNRLQTVVSELSIREARGGGGELGERARGVGGRRQRSPPGLVDRCASKNVEAARGLSSF